MPPSKALTGAKFDPDLDFSVTSAGKMSSGWNFGKTGEKSVSLSTIIMIAILFFFGINAVSSFQK